MHWVDKMFKLKILKNERAIGAFALLVLVVVTIILSSALSKPASPVSLVNDGTQSYDSVGEETPTSEQIINGELFSKSPRKTVEFSILTNYSEDSKSDFTTDSIGLDSVESNMVSRAVYARNERALDEYGIKVVEYSMPNADGEAIRTELSGRGYDLVALPVAGQLSTLLTGGYLADANNAETLDLSASYFDQNCISDLSIGKSVYIMSGSLITTDDDAVWCTVYNIDNAIAAGYSETEFEEYAMAGQWTADKMFEIMQSSSIKFDGLDSDYIYALNSSSDATFALCLSTGGNAAAKNADNIPSITVSNADFYNSFLKALILNTDVKLVSSDDEAFTNKDALFSFMNMIDAKRAGATVNAGILPMPKYSALQAKYRSPLDLTCAVAFALPASGNLATSGANLKILSKISAESLDSAYRSDLPFKTANSLQMFDTIKNTYLYDLVDMFGWGDIKNALAGITFDGGQDEFSSVMDARTMVAEKAMSIVLKRLLGS
jgi:hypothetical protein